jgi:uncharacterized membrane protein YdbT with pleckstrin-like domain
VQGHLDTVVAAGILCPKKGKKMSYVSRNLMPGEDIVAIARLHWLVFLRAMFYLVLSITLLNASNFFERPVVAWSIFAAGLVFLFFFFIRGIAAAIRYWTSEYAVTSKRLIVKVGLIRRDSLELLLAKVEAVGVNQSILGRLFGYGTLVITGTGGSSNSYNTISSPLAFRREVQEQVGSVQDRP